ncbi:MAG: hypothetical protein ACTSPD_06770, partial [Promethearchaeota archaeon]
GVLILIFAKKNRDIIDTYAMTAGIFIIITFLLNSISAIIFTSIFFDYIFLYSNHSINGTLAWYVYVALINISITFYVLGLILYIIHGKKNKDKYFMYAMIMIIIRSFTMNYLYLLTSLIFLK